MNASTGTTDHNGHRWFLLSLGSRIAESFPDRCTGLFFQEIDSLPELMAFFVISDLDMLDIRERL